MYIQPNSDIKILKGVNLDKSYNHTIRFPSDQRQYGFFTNTISGYDSGVTTAYNLTAYYYQRHSIDKIKVAISCDDLYDCNYMMFRNSSYGSKWFYAFIEDVEYVNDNCSIIKYSIDVMQTWMFDFDVGQCFVEREHTVSDDFGANTVQEDFVVQDYVISDVNPTINASDMLYAIVTNVELRGLYYEANGYQPICSTMRTIEEMISIYLHDHVSTNYKISTAYNRAQIGIPDGLYIYTGILPDDEGANGERPTDQSQYFYQTDNRDISTYRPVLNLSKFLSYLESGNLYYLRSNGAEDEYIHLTTENVICIYQYPKVFSKITNNTDAIVNEGYKYGNCSLDTWVHPNIGTKFAGKNEANNVDFSSVKNNKLFTFPFIKFSANSYTGIDKQFKFEDFKSDIYYPAFHTNIVPSTSKKLPKPSFEVVGNYIGKCEITLIPLAYKCSDENHVYPQAYSEKVVYNYTNIPFYSGNAYAEFMQRNANSINFGVIASGLNFIGSIIASAVTYNPVPAVGAGIALSNHIGSTIGKVSDLKNTAPSSYFNTETFLSNINFEKISFDFITYTVDGETAKIIDNYFSMFGYAINEIKTPNVFKYLTETNYNHLRPAWNYVKTKGAIIHPRESTSNSITVIAGLPADAEKKISDILDNGITFWEDGSKIGDYTQDNRAYDVR